MALETRSGFKENHREFGLHIRSEEARRPANIIARKIAIKANSIAPVGDGEKESKKRGRQIPVKGSYAAVTGEDAGNLRVGRNSRAIAKVINPSPAARRVEGGTKYQRAQRTLLRAAIAVSMREFGHFDGREN